MSHLHASNADFFASWPAFLTNRPQCVEMVKFAALLLTDQVDNAS